MEGWLHVVEGVRQMRGECGERQVNGARGLPGHRPRHDAQLRQRHDPAQRVDETNMTEYLKPLPTLNDENRPFWDGARATADCSCSAATSAAISAIRSAMSARAASPTTSSGAPCRAAAVFSYIVFHQVYHQAFKPRRALQRRAGAAGRGPTHVQQRRRRMPTTSPKVGDAVQAVFDAVTAEVTLPRFRLLAS